MPPANELNNRFNRTVNYEINVAVYVCAGEAALRVFAFTELPPYNTPVKS